MSCHHIDFVAFDHAGKDDLGLPINDPLTESLDHRPGIAGAQSSSLAIG